MTSSITARHCEISDELRARTETVLSRLEGHVAGPIDAAVVFDVVPTGGTAEIRIHASRGEVYVASAEAKDHRSALDRAEDRIRRQLDKASTAPKRGRGVQDAV